jgi:hypothetical protein
MQGLDHWAWRSPYSYEHYEDRMWMIRTLLSFPVCRLRGMDDWPAMFGSRVYNFCFTGYALMVTHQDHWPLRGMRPFVAVGYVSLAGWVVLLCTPKVVRIYCGVSETRPG